MAGAQRGQDTTQTAAAQKCQAAMRKVSEAARDTEEGKLLLLEAQQGQEIGPATPGAAEEVNTGGRGARTTGGVAQE